MGVVIRTYDQLSDNRGDDLSLDDLICWLTNTVMGLFLSPFLRRKQCTYMTCAARRLQKTYRPSQIFFLDVDINLTWISIQIKEREQNTVWYLDQRISGDLTLPSVRAGNLTAMKHFFCTDLWPMTSYSEASTDPRSSKRWWHICHNVGEERSSSFPGLLSGISW